MRMHIIPSNAFAAALVIPAAALAQPSGPERVRPGAPLDSTFIHAGADSLAIMMTHDGQILRAGTAVLETVIDDAPGGRRVVHVQRLLIEGQPEPIVADSMIVHWGTLLPISAHTRGDDPRDYFFGPGGARIVSLRDSTVLEVALDEPVFYTVAELLLRALPLRPGYHAVLPVIAEDGPPGELRVRVTGEERARTLDGGSCPALVVHVDEGAFEGTFYLNPANRSVVRFESPYGMLVRPTGCP